MAFQLGYDGKTLTLEDPSDFRVRRRTRSNRVEADSGQSEVSVTEYYDEIFLGIDFFDDAAVEAALHDWWGWAGAGGVYSLAIDHADVVNTTLASSATAGDASVEVTSATGITAGRRYKIIDADGAYQEIVKVADGYGGGTTVTLDGTLKVDRAAGAIFRSRDYYPSLESLDDQQPWTENPNLTWTLQHSCRESK